MATTYTTRQRDVVAGSVTVAAAGTDSSEFDISGHGVVAIRLPTIDAGTVTYKVKVHPDDTATILRDAQGNVVTHPSGTGGYTYVEPALAGMHSVVLVLAAQTGGARTIQISAAGQAVGGATPHTRSGGDTFIAGQTAMSGSAAVIVAARANRRHVIVKNIDASLKVYVGEDASVTTSNGLELAAGESVTVETTQVVYGIAASGTPNVQWLEVFDG